MKGFCAGIAALAALVAAPAFAADLPVPPMASPVPPLPPPAIFSWTGIYLGGQGGFLWGNSSGSETATQFCATGAACGPVFPVGPFPLNNTNLTGPFGGGTLGFNWQVAQIVFGVEGDWSAANINGSNACGAAAMAFNFGALSSGTCTTNLREFATATGRVGFAFDRALFYLKGGGVWARYNYTSTTFAFGAPGPAASFSSSRFGYTIGGGLEYALTANWSVKVEYQHMGFQGKTLTYPYVNVPPFVPGVFNVSANDSERADIVRAGVNFKFGWGMF